MGNEIGSNVGFGSPQQQVDMHARPKNTFIVFKRLPNNSLNDSFVQLPPLRDANLRWLVRLVSFSFHHTCNAW